MLLIYNLFIRIYSILIFFASFFNKKAKKWITGRKTNNVIRNSSSIWFHFASLGEFEQGRPVLEKFRASQPNVIIVITFFSPSGYQVRKNTPLADHVYYLPLDTARNAARFIDNISPAIAIFTKYEFWFHYFNELHKRGIPLYLISGIFRPKQVFFKWYGGLHRKMLTYVTHFFVQNDESKLLLKGINLLNATVSGDTRFDMVWQNTFTAKKLDVIERFKSGKPIFIGGSTWPEDEALIARLVPLYPGWKFIFAPHEIEEGKIARLIKLLPAGKFIRYSEIEADKLDAADYNILIIDNIGMLSSLYQYGNVAYIGGGFGAGIHNTLEAAAFRLPVLFGPNYKKFKEARDMVRLQLGFTVNNMEGLKPIAAKLILDDAYRLTTGTAIKDYVKMNTGATEIIFKAIAGN